MQLGRRSSSIIVALALALAASGMAEAAQPVVPAPRVDAVMAQAPDGRLVLFGGRGSAGALDDTWTFDGNSWSRQSPSLHPSARWGASMAPVGSGTSLSTVLFGGRGPNPLGQDGVLGDTWSWDGQAWTLRASAGPPAREAAAMSQDEARENVLLFGGRQGENDAPLEDTWTYDGAWTPQLVSSSPSERSDTAAAYYAPNATVVLFGGLGASRYLADTYAWDGVSWLLLSPFSSPPARADHAMAFDAPGRALLFGGVGGTGTLRNDTWLWNGVDWRGAVDGPQPPARRGAAMAYHPGTQRVVLFGGLGASGPLSDTWLWGGQRWKRAK